MRYKDFFFSIFVYSLLNDEFFVKLFDNVSSIYRVFQFNSKPLQLPTKFLQLITKFQKKIKFDHSKNKRNFVKNLFFKFKINFLN